MFEEAVETLSGLGWRTIAISLGTVDLAGEALARPVETWQDFIRRAERRGNQVARRLERSNPYAKRYFNLVRGEAGQAVASAGQTLRSSLGVISALTTETASANGVRRGARKRTSTRRARGAKTVAAGARRRARTAA